MAQLTPNYGLSMPEPTDPFGYNSFLPLFNENMEIIDENMGGGGGSTYTAGDGIDITNDTISLAYLKVVNGAVNIVFDDGN